ncbi:MAG TPA: efflux RND transporter permease subunit [Nevskiaceae bacterium]|nr:efflux RND transporter permease subunit [Nevskiaceae bacterium]
MNLSGLFIRRPIATSLLAAGALILGFVAYTQLPISALPEVNLPFIFVSVSEPGASPQTMAATVATPLERHLGSIAGVSDMVSSSRVGGASVVLQFDPSRSVDGAARDVQAAINAAAPDLPTGLPSPPVYHKANPSDAPILILAMTSKTLSVQDVYTLANNIVGQRIRQVDGVSEAEVEGGANPSVRVAVNPAQLAAMDLTMDDVRTAIDNATDFAPKGSLENDGRSIAIAANDQLNDPAAFGDIILTNKAGAAVRLSSVATITSGQQDNQQAAWFDNHRAVLIMVRKQADANVIKTADAVKALIPQLSASLPPSVKLTLMADRTQTIRASVDEVQITLLIALALVVMVMFLFLRRGVPTMIAGVTVPLAIAITFGAMWFMGYSLDNLSLMALTISVGFVVDDAIVVIENIVRHLDAGEPPLAAALHGGREIGFTVVSMSLSLVAVFIPLLFMGGIMGTFFVEFSATLVMAILASMVVSLTLTPSLCGRFLRKEKPAARRSLVVRSAEHGFDVLHRSYEHGLAWALHHRKTMFALTFAALAMTMWLYTAVPKGFFPQQDTGQMMGTVMGDSSISFEAMSAHIKQATDILLADPAVQSVSGFTGGSGWRSGTNRGSLFISLKPTSQRHASVQQVINRLRPKFTKIIGVSVFLRAVQDLHGGATTSTASYLYALHGDDLTELYTWAPKLVDALKASPLFTDVSSDLDKAAPQVNVVIDRNAASRLGIAISSIDAALNNSFSQRQVATIYDALNTYRVVLVAQPQFQLSPADFKRVYVKTRSGTAVPLATVAHIQYGLAPLSVSHESGFPVVNISYSLAPGVSLGKAAQAIQQAMLNLHMPGDIHGGGSGKMHLFAQSTSQQPVLILAALATIYVVLGILYESLVHPLTILSTLPSAGLGALLALILFGSELDVVSIIGIILLMGIVQKNAILMIDFAIEARRTRGLSPVDAIYEACLVRFRPILMTSLAAMLGALPLAIGFGTGSELRVPLGIAIVGGLIVSQFLTLFTTPVFYLAFEGWSAWWRRHVRHARVEVAPTRA